MNAPANADRTTDRIVEDAARDMADRWQRGERPLAEEYFSRIPALKDRLEAALDLIAEELALRDDFRCPTAVSDLTARFPEWREHVRALHECQRLLGPTLSEPAFPEPGESLGDFHLHSELGRGGHARVYRATQPSLAGRSVVLKVSPDRGSEHLSLARLQHSNIVPLYSAHEFPDRGLRGLCLPDFGGTTLDTILARVEVRGPRPVSGRDLLDAAEAGEALSANGSAARAFLSVATYERAVCWIGACLADALQYAHDRNLLHLDVKPSNVLIAADGVPMLLDFHLARPPLCRGDTAPHGLGGTPGFMAPEQAAALDAVRAGKPIPSAIDARADVFALGVLLRVLLTRTGPNRGSVALTDVLAKCVAKSPDDRYATAAGVAADLRRHLTDLPLKGVPNRNWAERIGKWRRRRPFAVPLAFAFAALVVAAIGTARHVNRLADRALDAYRDGQAYAVRQRYDDAIDAFRRGEALLDGIPFHGSLRSRLIGARLDAEKGRAANDLHRFVEQVRPYFDTSLLSPDQRRTVRARCGEVWTRRDDLAAALSGQASEEFERRWQDDLRDVALLMATLDGAGRDQLLRIPGPTTDGTPDPTPRTANDFLVLGRGRLADGDTDGALRSFDRCLGLNPQSFWGHYYKGVACLRANSPTEAVAEFTACVTLRPDTAWCHYNRGLAFHDANRPDSALRDLDRALSLDPSLTAAYLARAALHQRVGRTDRALDDLTRAKESGGDIPEIDYRKAVVYLAADDRDKARRALNECLRRAPNHAGACDLLKTVMQK